MENLTFFQYLLIAGLGYLIYLVKIFLPEYVKKKAENLAQSEDIEKLTTLVKEVEFKFEERSQNLRAQLDLTNQFQLGLHNEERASLITLHNFMYQYIFFLTDVTFGGIDFEDNSSLTSKLTERSQNSYLFIAKVSSVALFLKNDIENEIEKLAKEVHTDILFQGQKMIDYIGELTKLNDKLKIQSEAYNTYYADRRLLHDEYQKGNIDFISEISPKLSLLSKQIKKYLESRTTSNYTA